MVCHVVPTAGKIHVIALAPCLCGRLPPGRGFEHGNEYESGRAVCGLKLRDCFVDLFPRGVGVCEASSLLSVHCTATAHRLMKPAPHLCQLPNVRMAKW